ncbi:MAG: hypothetical protein MZV49_03295 [Rhodopseudomonas palustris]|nr:hypothetical protein [Rhodopseudomonas palustris]
MLFGYEWELTKSPAGANQWHAEGRRRGAHDSGRRTIRSKKHAPMMTDRRPVAALRPDLREDLAALPQRTRRRSPTPSPAPGSS